MVKKSLMLAMIFLSCVFLMSNITPSYGLNIGDNWGIDGYVRNDTGFWTENSDYSLNNDPLATCRNWLRVNLNGSFSRKIDLKAEVLGVYEPEYSRERGAGIEANEYNYFDFRELRVDWKMSPGHSLRVGRQIVNWGEAISARVGDVINPQDIRWELGFTNLEDTRMPIWMARGLHNFKSINLGIDWVFSPYIEPDRYRVWRIPSNATRIKSDGSFTPFIRFASWPETRIEKQFGTHDTVIAIPTPGGTMVLPGFTVGPPYSYAYIGPFTNIQAQGLFGAPMPGMAYPALGAYLGYVPKVTYDYPDSSIEESRYGFRTSSSIIQWQTGIYYWHGNEGAPIMRVKGGLPTIPGRPLNIGVEYPEKHVYGFYANKNFQFGVVRIDAAFTPDKEFNTTKLGKYPEAIAEKDHLIAQLGFDKTFMWPLINPDQGVSITAEYVGEFIFGDLDDIHLPTYFIPYHKDSHTLFFTTNTTYSYGKYNPSFTVIANNRGSGLISPTFTYVPSILNSQLSFSASYKYIYGDHYDYPYGLKSHQDMVVFTTQYSF